MAQPTTHVKTTARSLLTAVGGAVLLVAAVYFLFPSGDKLGTALRYTARWSFLWFTAATLGGALVTLFGPRFEPLARRGRDLGLSFAGAHSVHVALVAWYLHVSPSPFSRSALPTLAFFGTGVAFMYLLALLSLPVPFRKAVSARTGRLLRTVGVEYIAYVYFSDFYGRTFHGGTVNLIVYMPFLAVSVAAPALRIAARIKRRRERHAGRDQLSITAA